MQLLRTFFAVLATSSTALAASRFLTVPRPSSQLSGSINARGLVNDPLPPSQDPWYTAPAGYEAKAPGTILRLRQAPGNVTSVTGNCSAAYNILYRTTGSRYQPTWAVTTLLLPAFLPQAALLSYQTAYDSVDLDASPSYTLHLSKYTEVAQALGKGWIVTVPDYEGPLASFTAGVLSGHATLDGVRASLEASSILGLPSNLTTALWGYSGGALASEWAAELQVQYAPELNISGAALGGLTPNVTSVLLSIDGSIEVGLAPAAVLGLVSQHPDLEAYLLGRLKTEGTHNRTGFEATRRYDLSEAIGAYALQNISDYFVGGLTDLLANPQVQRLINSDGIMTYHGVPQFPIYAYKAIQDAISVVADTDALVDKYCAVGANILYERNTVGGHSAESTNGNPAALAWLESIFNGTYATAYQATGCTTRDVTVALSTVTF